MSGIWLPVVPDKVGIATEKERDCGDVTGGVPVVVNGVPRVPNPEPVAPSEAINDLILVPVWTKVGLMYDEKTAERLLNDPVSRHLHQDFARILVSQTVGEALDGLRRHPPQGRILYLYVVDDQGRLAGVVPTRRLLLAVAGTAGGRDHGAPGGGPAGADDRAGGVRVLHPAPLPGVSRGG